MDREKSYTIRFDGSGKWEWGCDQERNFTYWQTNARRTVSKVSTTPSSNQEGEAVEQRPVLHKVFHPETGA